MGPVSSVQNLYGFKLDFSSIPPADRANVSQGLQRQINKFLGLGLPVKVVDRLKAVPIRLANVSTDSVLNGTYPNEIMRVAAYYDSEQITIPSSIGIKGANFSQTVLTHELMHAFQTELMSPVDRQLVDKFYKEALKPGTYPYAKGYLGSPDPLSPRGGFNMFKDSDEFFAETATSFLSGENISPPLSRQAIKRAQPQYYEFLKRLFGFQGSGL